MKGLATLLLLGSLAYSSAWKVGQQLEYSYSGKSFAGIYKFSERYAINEIRGKLLIQVVDEETLTVQLSDVTAAEDPAFDGNPFAADDYLNFHLGDDAKKLTITDRESLERPFQIKHNSGAVKNIQVSIGEPVFAVNFKKALASALQLHINANDEYDDSPLVEHVFYGDEEESNIGLAVTENSILGNCVTGLTVTRLTGAQVITNKNVRAAQKHCDKDSQVYKISKQVDHDSCTKRPVFNLVTPPTINCKPGGSKCDNTIQQAAGAVYYACYASEGGRKVIRGDYFNDYLVAPFGSESEKLFTSGCVTVLLQKSGVIQTPLQAPIYPIVHESLAYVFPETKDREWTGNAHEPGFEDAPVTRPYNILTQKDSIVALLREVATSLGKNASRESSFDFTNRLSEVRRFVALLKLSEIRAIFIEIDANEKPTVRQLLLDVLATSGTPATAKFVADVLRQGTLGYLNEDSSAADIAMMLFNHVNVPTKELLTDLVDLVKSLEKGQKNEYVHKTALMGMAELLYHACGSTVVGQRRFSMGVYGTFCSTDDEVYTDFVEYLAGLLNGATTNFDKMAYLTVAGTLGTNDVFQILLPYIRGAVDQSAAIRTRALLALHRYAYSAPEKVIPVVASLYDNMAENPEVRMASLAILLNSNAPYAMWQKVAWRTWFELNNQVAAFTHSLLQNLAELPSQNAQYTDLIGKAKAAVQIAKEFKSNTLYSRSSHFAEWLDVLNAGHLVHVPIWKTGTQEGPVASGLRVMAQFGPHVFTYFQIYRWSYGFEELRDKIVQAFSKPIKQSRPREINFAQSDLDNLFKQLGVEGPAKEQINTFMQIGLGANMHRLFTLDEADKNLPRIIKRIHDAINQEGGYDINIQKFRSWTDILISVPTVIGVPTTFEGSLPSLQSLHGNIKGRIVSPRDLGVTLQGNGVISWAYVAKLSISVPFANSLVAAGVESRTDIRNPRSLGIFRKVADYDDIDNSIKVRPGNENADWLLNRVVPFVLGGACDDFKPLANKTGFSVLHVSQPKVKDISPVKGLPTTITSERPVSEYKSGSYLSKVLEYGYPKNVHYYEFKSSFVPGKLRVPEIKLSFKKVRNLKYYSDNYKYVSAGTGSTVSRPIASASVEYDIEADSEIKGGFYSNRKLALHLGEKEVGSVTLKVAQDFEDTIRKISLVVKAGNYSGCLKTKRDAPLLSRFENSAADLQSTISLQFSKGEDCAVKTADGEIILTRSAAQLNHARASAAGKACAADVAAGIHDSKDCSTARRLADVFDKVSLKVIGSSNSDLLNVVLPWLTSKIRARNPGKFVVSSIPNNDNFKLDAQFTPAGDAYDFVSRHHGEETTYSNIPVKFMAIPVNVRKNSYDQMVEVATRGAQNPVCYVSADRVQTFDGVTYDYAIDECDHLLTSDCSGKSKFAILARKSSAGNVTVRIVTEADRFEIDSDGVVDLNKKVTVRLNKEGLATVNEGKVKSTIYKRKHGEFLFVSSVANVFVYIRGKLVTVKTSFHHPGRLCGLCGDNNYEQSKEFSTPKRCAVSSGALMAASYRVNSPSCSPLEEDVRTALADYQTNCQSVDEIIRSALPIMKDNCKMNRRGGIVCT